MMGIQGGRGSKTKKSPLAYGANSSPPHPVCLCVPTFAINIWRNLLLGELLCRRRPCRRFKASPWTHYRKSMWEICFKSLQ